jgi:hypothetical protein
LQIKVFCFGCVQLISRRFQLLKQPLAIKSAGRCVASTDSDVEVQGREDMHILRRLEDEDIRDTRSKS